MHRLLVDTVLLERDSLALSDAAMRHFRVLRPEAGERFELFDGRGTRRVFTVADPRSGVLNAAGAAMFDAPPAAKVTLFACITKGSRWDWTIEKAVELGVSRIVPVISERTIVRIPASERETKRARWVRIAEDAARQSDAKWIPEIAAPADFRAALEMASRTACFAGALTEPPSPPLLAAVESCVAVPEGGYSVFIGPEGDFTPAELAALLKVSRPAGFGPTVLRAETAAIFALSVLTAVVRR